MAKKEKIKITKGTKRCKGKVVQAKSACASTSKKRGWSYLLDNVDYSSGPGDNIYVYG